MNSTNLNHLAAFIESHGQEVIQITEHHVVWKLWWVDTNSGAQGYDLIETSTFTQAREQLGY